MTFAHEGENTNAIATKVLYDLIVADKVFLENSSVNSKMGGAFLNKDTRKYVKDYFIGLSTPWWYKLNEKEIEGYRNIIEKRYGTDEVLLFDEAVKINLKTVNKKLSLKKEIEKLINITRNEKNILIYGAGQRGIALGYFLKDRIGKIGGYIISDDRNKEEFNGLDEHIYHLGEIINCKDEYQILVAVADPEVRENLQKYNFKYIDLPNFIFPFIKEYFRMLC